MMKCWFFPTGICFDYGFSLFAGTKTVAEPILVSVYCCSLVLPVSLCIIALDLCSAFSLFFALIFFSCFFFLGLAEVFPRFLVQNPTFFFCVLPLFICVRSRFSPSFFFSLSSVLLFPFLVLCPVFSVQNEDNSGKKHEVLLVDGPKFSPGFVSLRPVALFCLWFSGLFFNLPPPPKVAFCPAFIRPEVDQRCNVQQ